MGIYVLGFSSYIVIKNNYVWDIKIIVDEGNVYGIVVYGFGSMKDI